MKTLTSFLDQPAEQITFQLIGGRLHAVLGDSVSGPLPENMTEREEAIRQFVVGRQPDSAVCPKCKKWRRGSDFPAVQPDPRLCSSCEFARSLRRVKPFEPPPAIPPAVSLPVDPRRIPPLFFRDPAGV